MSQVDARIYLWRWDTRIVISDVDGTITKSDVLGQFMPLVGRDWSHISVTHLFSGIKENGYQMLYLSARAISQASITRQFLFNLKQDGKALPDGPVVISPDGLFPSLFCEVIRRAPHEFKIACLEDINACFPPDRNPFYAGFGNRYRDEFSYLKVGISKGKIFIINPKGEVIINRSIIICFSSCCRKWNIPTNICARGARGLYLMELLETSTSNHGLTKDIHENVVTRLFLLEPYRNKIIHVAKHSNIKITSIHLNPKYRSHYMLIFKGLHRICFVLFLYRNYDWNNK